jgi:hypothetical protein
VDKAVLDYRGLRVQAHDLLGGRVFFEIFASIDIPRDRFLARRNLHEGGSPSVYPGRPQMFHEADCG